MPKVTAFKKELSRKESQIDLLLDAGVKINNGNDEFHLCNDGSVGAIDNSANRSFDLSEKRKKRKNAGERKELEKSSSSEEKPSVSSQDIKGSGDSNRKNSTRCDLLEDSDKKGGNGTVPTRQWGNAEKSGISRKSIERREGVPQRVSDGDIETSGRFKKKRGNDRTPSGGIEKERTKSEKIKLADYPISSFPESNSIMGPKTIHGGPVKISDEFEVWIIIDGKRYKVSEWSVKGGVYYQGFDSHYLVNNFHPSKSNK